MQRNWLKVGHVGILEFILERVVAFVEFAVAWGIVPNSDCGVSLGQGGNDGPLDAYVHAWDLALVEAAANDLIIDLIDQVLLLFLSQSSVAAIVLLILFVIRNFFGDAYAFYFQLRAAMSSISRSSWGSIRGRIMGFALVALIPWGLWICQSILATRALLKIGLNLHVIRVIHLFVQIEIQNLIVFGRHHQVWLLDVALIFAFVNIYGCDSCIFEFRSAPFQNAVVGSLDLALRRLWGLELEKVKYIFRRCHEARAAGDNFLELKPVADRCPTGYQLRAINDLHHWHDLNDEQIAVAWASNELIILHIAERRKRLRKILTAERKLLPIWDAHEVGHINQLLLLNSMQLEAVVSHEHEFLVVSWHETDLSDDRIKFLGALLPSFHQEIIRLNVAFAWAVTHADGEELVVFAEGHWRNVPLVILGFLSWSAAGSKGVGLLLVFSSGYLHWRQSLSSLCCSDGIVLFPEEIWSLVGAILLVVLGIWINSNSVEIYRKVLLLKFDKVSVLDSYGHHGLRIVQGNARHWFDVAWKTEELHELAIQGLQG